MTATNHGLFGATIAILLHTHPVIAVASAPASHFLLDALPHYGSPTFDPKSKTFRRILIADIVLAVVSTLVVAWVWQEYALLIVVCAFLAASPDIMWLYYVYIRPDLFHRHVVPRFHSWIQWSQTPRGSIVESIWFVLFLSAIIYFGW